MSDYFEGQGCKCMAYGKIECSCPDVDWTDPEVYKLRKQVEELEEEVKDLLFVTSDCDCINRGRGKELCRRLRHAEEEMQSDHEFKY